MNSLRMRCLLFASAVLVSACGGVNSDARARQAYQGLDAMVEKAINLGFQGFKSANSANIDAQTANGTATGTVTVSGQVDQGASANKGMRLRVGLVEYSDGEVVIPDEAGVTITYATDSANEPMLDVNMKNIPNGTFDGALKGPVQMKGDVDGDVTLNLTFAGELEDDGTGKPRRKAGTTTVTGTAQSGDGTYNVDVKR